jgi:hypothetical protein
MPVQDPEMLFDHPEYRRTGSMFWPDSLCERVKLFNQLGGVDDPWQAARWGPWQAETGQVLLNRCADWVHRRV